jgi:hypothetical protein
VGKSTYEDSIQFFENRNWEWKEYEKKQFKLIDEKNPEKGKNTFVMSKVKDLKGARSILVFFSPQRLVDAMIFVLEPNMFPVVMDELDNKYDLVKKNLIGDNFSENYTHVLWQKENMYIELQKLSEHLVRLVYVEKLLYENYKHFLFKPYESFRRREIKPEWMNGL